MAGLAPLRFCDDPVAGLRIMAAVRPEISPVCRSKENACQRHALCSETGGPGDARVPRILIADDQPDILYALRLLLGEAGFDVDLVNTTEAAADSVSRRTYDLLLMDLNYTRDTTSGREGLDLLDRVRVSDAGLPVVVMTGWGTVDTAVDAMRRGARSFVQKPWDDTTLVQVVRREGADGHAARRRDVTRAREHEEARLIQRALLPSEMPLVDGCRLAARWRAAEGIGGDCFDILRFDATQVAVSIADVIGKGLPAALLMSNLQAAVRAFATSEADPHEVCGRVNRLLCRNVDAGKFITFCYAIVDTAARTVRFANAGHNPPLLVGRDGSVRRLAPTGSVLGVSVDWRHSTGRLPLAPGDRLVCFTDGIPEARRADDEEFGEDRLIDLLRASTRSPAQQTVDLVMNAVTEWAGGAPQDDATVVAVEVDGAPEDA
jgi:sigma-B regulation protein RsbU (phosphoserine phosphatase)